MTTPTFHLSASADRRRWPSARVVGLAVLLMGIGQAAPARAVEGAQVKALCMAGFNAAMAAAGETPPPGMGDFTCACFLEQIESGRNIDQARSVCRDKAAARYPLK